jgi:sugar phosphate isomerase/epimerase
MGMRVGLCSVTFRALDPDAVLAAAVDAGVEAIEWGADVHVLPGDTAGAAAVARRCGEAGVAVASYGSYLAAGRSSAARLGPVLDAAEALSAPNVRVWCPFGAPPPPADAEGDALFGAAADDLAAWSAAAADRGLTLSLEFHVDTFTETAASTRRLLDAAGRPPALFTYWQPVDGRDAATELAAVAPDVSHLHVFHWTAGGERHPLADGAGVWPGLLGTTLGDRWPHERCAFLEFVRGDDPAQLVADARALRSWLAS